MSHPYKTANPEAFWSRAVAPGLRPERLIDGAPLIRAGERVASAGSCFAANIVPFLESAGIEYVRCGATPSPLNALGPDNFSYSKFSAGYGNIYTARAMDQLVSRALGRFQPIEDRWRIDGAVVDPFRPGLKWPAKSDLEFDLLMRQYLGEVLEAIRAADVFVFTLGLTEAWVSTLDGAVFPVCPGAIAGTYDPDRHRFHNFSVSEVIADLHAVVRLLQEVRPGLRIILTVSPVPLVATATQDHVLLATIYSKSVLRAAAGEIAGRYDAVRYFPAYEIITGPQAPYEFFEADRREPSDLGIRAVMDVLLRHCEIEGRGAPAASVAMAGQLPVPGAGPAPLVGEAPSMNVGQFAAQLSKVVADAECEEAAAGV